MPLSVTSKRASALPSPSRPVPAEALGVDEVLLLHLLNDLVDQLFDLVFGQSFELLLRLFVEELARFQRLTDGVAKVLQCLVVELAEVGVGVVEAGVQEEIREGLHKVFEAEARGEVAGELGVADAFHWTRLPGFLLSF